MMPEQLTADRVMVEIDRVVQSNDIWLFGDFYLNFIHALLPFSGGWCRGAARCLASYLLQKDCIIQIKNKDALCCTRAIVTARAMLDNHPKWHSIRQGRHEQLHLASQLHIDTGNYVMLSLFLFNLFLSFSHTLIYTICHRYTLYVYVLCHIFFTHTNKLCFFSKVYFKASFAVDRSGRSSRLPGDLPTSCTSSPGTCSILLCMRDLTR